MANNLSLKRAMNDHALNKLDEAIKLVEASATSPDVINAVKSARDAFKNRNKFTEDGSSDDSKICRDIEDQTYAHDWQSAFDQGQMQWRLHPRMLCGAAEGQFLKSLVSLQKAKRILEVGMFTGYSALSMAEALPADGEIVTVDICDYLKPLVENLIKDSPHSRKIKIVVGSGNEQMRKMVKNGDQFDMVFLDGDKSDYVEQFKILFDENLLSPGGTLIIDNAYTAGKVYLDPTNENSPGYRLLGALKERLDLHRVLLPLNDGVYMIRRLADVERESH